MKKENKENLSKESMNDIENMTDENINEMDQDQELSEDISDEAGDETIHKLESELSESKDKYLRLYSEFENFRRRTAREKLDLIDTANEGLMSALLPVLDDFERALKLSNEETDEKSIREGMDLIHQKLRKTLEQKGLVNMNTQIGDAFDPDFHEAITQIPAPEAKLKGKIVDVIEKGYLIKEKVIRYAKVVTGS
ncbi:nucleotide exchange factor GrpE [Fulvivirga sedimenti]|jgi:molecular chaperone GrpE|uniref:Protein GrpE n=1 Tax=Fulvivirga sedimenti TaxID=2879465 RepID=A0A9X1HWN8_9BACT|nr:nucleotide exchange factor GrpE [Fulvivirga sedimenti]MCA6078162.1 nucleotide exchange factor GrpE [Fulvivirga sedimenti]